MVVSTLSVAHKQENFDEIQTKLETNLIFPKGIIGFDSYNEFTFSSIETSPLRVLTSAPDKDVLFYLINPYYIRSDYLLDIEEDDYKLLEYPKENNLMVFSIVTMQDDPAQITCNLVGPILINIKNQRACQCINNGKEWSTKHYISTGLPV